MCSEGSVPLVWYQVMPVFIDEAQTMGANMSATVLARSASFVRRQGRIAVIGAAAAGILTAVGIAVPSGEAAATVTVPTLAIIAGNGTSGAPAPGPALSSPLDDPIGIVVDSVGDLYIADSSNNVIEKITPSGTLSIFAGTGSTGAPVAGAATSSPLNQPEGLAIDGAGNIYVADTSSNRIVKITPGGILSIVAGSGAIGAPNPGPAISSALDEPTGVAVDHSGNLYVADYDNQLVEKVTSSGTLSVIAGTGTYGTAVAGPATSSPLGSPSDVAVDSSGNVYVGVETSQVAKITPAGTLSIVAGTGTYGAVTPGPATASNLGWAYSLAFDNAGNFYVADYDNAQILKVTPSGTLSVVAGTGTGGTPTAGSPTASELDYPEGVAVDNAGNVYIADTYSNYVDEVIGLVPGAPSGVSATATSSAVTVTWSAPSGGPVPTSYTVTPIVNGVSGTPVVVTGTTYVLTGAIPGDSYSFEVAAGNGNGLGLALDSNTVTVPTVPPTPTGSGYWTVGSDGGVFSFGPTFYGSTGSLTLNQPVFAMTSTSDGKGYWFVAKDGGVFAYGDAAFHGSVPALGIHVTNIVGMAADTATGGYWLVGSDGAVYSFDAPFEGSVPGLGQRVSNVVGMAATADGGGYYLATSTGGVYAFGDAKYLGGANTVPQLSAPIVGISVDSATGGYWLAGSDGGVYAFGAPFEGSAGGTKLNAPVVGISATTNGSGYYLVASDGGILSYNAPFLGSMVGKQLNAPTVGMTVAG